jgi:hypothetical protein
VLSDLCRCCACCGLSAVEVEGTGVVLLWRIECVAGSASGGDGRLPSELCRRGFGDFDRLGGNKLSSVMDLIGERMALR